MLSSTLPRGIASNTYSTKKLDIKEFNVKLGSIPKNSVFQASDEHSTLNSDDECGENNVLFSELSSDDTSPIESRPHSPEKSPTDTPRASNTQSVYFSGLDNSSTSTSPAISPPRSNKTSRTSSIASDTLDMSEDQQIFHLEELNKVSVVRDKISVPEPEVQIPLIETPITIATIKRVKFEPITISFDKVTKKGEGEYHFANNWKIPNTEGYCDGFTNLFLHYFLRMVREPENTKQLKLELLDTFKINIGIFDKLKKTIVKKPYVLHSDKLANKYLTMRLDFMSKSIGGQLAADFIPQHFSRIGQIACYPKDMLKSLFDVISFMNLNQLGHMGLKIIADQHVVMIFVMRDEKRAAYIVYTMDPNEGARYKRTVITDEQTKVDFKDSTIFNFMTHRFLKNRIAVIDCLVDKKYPTDDFHSNGLINQVIVKHIPNSGPNIKQQHISIMSNMLFQAVETNNLQLLTFGINLLRNNPDVYKNSGATAVYKNGGSLDATLVNIALNLRHPDIAEMLIKEFEVPALSLGATHSYNGDIMRFTYAKEGLRTPLGTAIYTKSYKVLELLLDTDEEINKAGFSLNQKHKIEKGNGLKKTIELMLRERPELVKSAIIKLCL